MTILNALDMTMNDRNPTASHHTSDDTEAKRTEVTVDTHHIDLATSVNIDESATAHANPTDDREHNEDSLWMRATSMMGDLEGLGLKLKNEVELTLKQVSTKEQNDIQKITKLSRTLEDYQTEINSLKLNISALKAVADETREDLQTQLSQKDEHHIQVVTSFQSKIASLESVVEDLKSQNGELRLELDSTKDSLNEKPKMIVDSAKIDQMKLEIEEKESEILGLTEELQKIRILSEEKQEKIDSLEDDKAKLSSTLLEKDSDISDLNEKLQSFEDSYGGQIVLLEKQLADSQGALTQETQDKDYYMKQLEVVIAQYEGLQEKYKIKKKEHKELEQALELAKKTTGAAVTQSQVRYYQEIERKYVQAKK